MDDMLMTNDSIDWIFAALNPRCEITEDQDQASKIWRALCVAQREMKQDPNSLSYVTRRKVHIQQLEDALA